jgi:hypothetical protein
VTRLCLGAGTKQRKGWVNVDRAPLPGIDVVLDLDRPPANDWPWENGTVHAIEADNVFEHVMRPVWFMTESHRILRPGGSLRIITPHLSSQASWDDPTHVRHCTANSWDFWIPGTLHYIASNKTYGGVAYDKVSIDVNQGMIDVRLKKPA